MAKQEYGPLKGEFTLDLHNVQTKEAARVVRVRIAECYTYGIRSLKCVFGSPDRLQGSIAKAVLDIALTDERVISNALADWVFADEIDVLAIPIFLLLPLKRNGAALTLSAETKFSGLAPLLSLCRP